MSKTYVIHTMDKIEAWQEVEHMVEANSREEALQKLEEARQAGQAWEYATDCKTDVNTESFLDRDDSETKVDDE